MLPLAIQVLLFSLTVIPNTASGLDSAKNSTNFLQIFEKIVDVIEPKIDSLLDSHKNMGVDITLKPAEYFGGVTYVLTNDNITATATGVTCSKESVTYTWKTQSETMIYIDRPTLNYKFKKADDSTFLYVKAECNTTHSSGSVNKSLIVIDPVVIQEPEGNFFIEHGELLKLTMKFAGTGPFKYCYRFCFESDAKYFCRECDPNLKTETGQVKILHYLHSVGNYSLLLFVENIASQASTQYKIRILGTIHEVTTPIFPIICSIAAVLIILTGAALHLRFRKNLVHSETADFEFIRNDYDDEEWRETQTFWQRVRYLLFKAEDADSSTWNTSRSRLL